MTLASISHRLDRLEEKKLGKPKSFTIIGGQADSWEILDDETNTRYSSLAEAFNHLKANFNVVELTVSDFNVNISKMADDDIDKLIKIVQDSKDGKGIDDAWAEKISKPTDQLQQLEKEYPDLTIKHEVIDPYQPKI